MPSHHFRTEFIRSEFMPQLRAIVDALENRLLPGFANINDEARAVSDKIWGDFMSASASGDEDPADFAAEAQQAGVSHFMLLNSICQGMQNLFAAALYHAFEQQVMMLLRTQILDATEASNAKLFQMAEFQKRLNALGIDITKFPSWPQIDELRLVANTVKHAEGTSAQELHQIRPDLFKHPQIRKLGFSIGKLIPRVFLPMAGEDLYVSLQDVLLYRDTLLNFWEELAGAMEVV